MLLVSAGTGKNESQEETEESINTNLNDCRKAWRTHLLCCQLIPMQPEPRLWPLVTREPSITLLPSELGPPFICLHPFSFSLLSKATGFVSIDETFKEPQNGLFLHQQHKKMLAWIDNVSLMWHPCSWGCPLSHISYLMTETLSTTPNSGEQQQGRTFVGAVVQISAIRWKDGRSSDSLVKSEQ